MRSIPEIRKLVDDYIRDNRFHYAPIELYQPMDYILDLGGKRLRPITLLLAMQLFSDDVVHGLPAAFAIELFHNFSLIHDDIMDEAPLRRGHTTVHKKWGTNTGILSGDAMLIYSYKFLNRSCSSKNSNEINRIFSDTAIVVCEGQQMDMNFEIRENVSQADYIEMIYKKTAALIEGSMQIGALLVGAEADDIKRIGNFARNLGISFQLQDDLLDSFGNSSSVGKRLGGDIIQNKKTILFILAMETASSKTRGRLNGLYSSNEISDDDKVSGVIEIFEDLSVEDRASALRDQYHQMAFNQLDLIDLSDKRKQPLMNFAQGLLKRDF